ncbi:GNAT family N-acetyltransferase [Cohnella faecalis]|uniref:GNAT family N-acetyltransferase n=1 Tax=Cohnella faecalis TaxID=2315694 RepID=A0A398CNP9_9BACL|nr:GNAT family N-acetyltransferase [Cohnella faecalis]RIE01201.1 GNAT family N-acetyltransferase [Cohnella faecalis]
MNVIIERALVSDAEQILTLQKLAFRSEAESISNYEIEPLVQTIENFKSQFESHIVLKAISDGTIIGSVRAYVKDGTCFIGKLIVQPEYQGRGIGKSLMEEIEKACPATRFELFTGSNSEKNIGLYNRLGYQVFKREVIGHYLTLVFLEKSCKSLSH